MFNVGGGEILVILLLALLVLGPDKLPEYARKAGRYMNEFRRMTSGFQEEFRQAMDLSDTGTPTTSDDALHRTTEGPRLQPQAPATPAPQPAAAPPSAEPVGELPVAPAAAPPPASGPTIATPPAAATPPPAAPAPTSTPGAFAADVTPAPGTGPELVVPPRPPVGREDGSGSSAA